MRLLRLSCALFAASSALASSGTLLRYDFNTGAVWPVTAEKADQPGVVYGKFGTVDTGGSAERSGGPLPIIDRGPQPGWSCGRGAFVGLSATAGNEPLALQNEERSRGKLTLGASRSASRALPLTLRVVSFDTGRVCTGAFETTVYPAAADFYERYAHPKIPGITDLAGKPRPAHAAPALGAAQP